jgi:hypothetical protein
MRGGVHIDKFDKYAIFSIFVNRGSASGAAVGSLFLSAVPTTAEGLLGAPRYPR